MDFSNTYLLVKAFHIIAVIAWMAGLLYLPRLYVYHTQVAVGSDQDKLFQKMEHRLLRYIMNPAMIVALILGGWLMYITGVLDPNGLKWFHAKSLLLVALFGTHGMMSKYRKDFTAGKNTKSARFYRVLNEVPTLLMIVIVVLAVVKPF